MNTTLYLLRHRPEHISSSLFKAGEADTNIVYIEEALSMASPAGNETVISPQKIGVSESQLILTDDNLIEKIFSSDHIIVL